MHKLTDITIIRYELLSTSDVIIGSGELSDLNYQTIVSTSDGKPFIPGSSIAGALKDIFLQHQKVFNENDTVFKHFWGDSKFGAQSHIIFNSAVCKHYENIEIKDSVSINHKTRTGLNRAKFQYERLTKGAIFEGQINIKIRNGFDRENFLKLSQFIITCLNKGIRLGAKENKAYGHFILNKPLQFAHFEAIKHTQQWFSYLENKEVLPSNLQLNIEGPIEWIDSNIWKIEVGLNLKNTLINSVSYKNNGKEIKSFRFRNVKKTYMLHVDAESILGPISHQYLRNLKTLNIQDTSQHRSLFGYVDKTEKESRKARISISASTYEKPTIKEIANIKISRWTQAEINSGLRISRVVENKTQNEPTVKFTIKIRDATTTEKRIMHHIIRDLATGIVTIGGQQSVGRGIFEGGYWLENNIKYAINKFGEINEIKL